MNPRAALLILGEFAGENQHSGTGGFLRDLLKAVHGGGGRIELAPMLRLADELGKPLVIVLQALLVGDQPRLSRLHDIDIVEAFRGRGALEFFHTSARASIPDDQR